jgi:hypothetical protein
MENNTIQKPISVIIEEVKANIVRSINEANLHPTLLELIIKDIYNEVVNNKNMIYEREKMEYESKLVNQNFVDDNSIEEDKEPA